MSIVSEEVKQNNNEKRVDLREQLFNEGLSGPIHEVSTSVDRIYRLNGILFDIDPKLYRTGGLLDEAPTDPEAFYRNVARKWLQGHDVLRRAEVRLSGTGLHSILWFNEPIEICDDSTRVKWAARVGIVQAILPVDPQQPGLNAMTRPLGSTNSKNGAEVRQLKAGEGVSEEEVDGLISEMCREPFTAVMRVLAGADRLYPCPCCRGEGMSLKALGGFGQCYGCGRVTLDRLYDLVFTDQRDMRNPKKNMTRKSGGKHGQ
jgi:hypothetical protein